MSVDIAHNQRQQQHRPPIAHGGHGAHALQPPKSVTLSIDAVCNGITNDISTHIRQGQGFKHDRHGLKNVNNHQLELEKEQVRALQKTLKELGLGDMLGKGGVDGLFGPCTKKALMALQANIGLLQSGVLDENTASALRQITSQRGQNYTQEPVQKPSEQPPGPDTTDRSTGNGPATREALKRLVSQYASTQKNRTEDQAYKKMHQILERVKKRDGSSSLADIMDHVRERDGKQGVVQFIEKVLSHINLNNPNLSR